MQVFILLLLAFLAGQRGADAKAFSEASDLKLVITAEQQVINSPLPALITLHLHNSGNTTLWLYSRASPQPIAGQAVTDASQAASANPAHPQEGSTLSIQLEPADNRVASPGAGELLNNSGLPHPRLIRLAQGEDYEEKSVIRVAPAQAELNGEKRPIWGRYKFAVTYEAKFLNTEELVRNVGVKIWQGAVQSNSLEIELQPPVPSARGSITGTVTGSENVPRSDVLISLSDREERLLSQARTDFDGKFSFTHLPLGLYWITVRRTDFTEDTIVFRHLVLSSAEPAGTMDFLLTPPETYLPKQMLHKPMLFRVTDGAGAPLGNVSLESTWSSGTVLDSVKGRTSDDGTAALELIPGRNYVTLKRKGCPNDEERIDVASGPGIDGARIVLECSKK